MSKEDGTGRKWVTGGHAAFREELVAWPEERAENAVSEARDDAQPAAAPTPAVSTDARADDEGLRAELERAKSEARRLLARIHDLVEENERLRRQIRTQFPR